MDVPERTKTLAPSMSEFLESAKAGKTEELLKQQQDNQTDNKKKKPVLSLKNILAFCVLSIAGGYSLRFAKNHTKIGKDLLQLMSY